MKPITTIGVCLDKQGISWFRYEVEPDEKIEEDFRSDGLWYVLSNKDGEFARYNSRYVGFVERTQCASHLPLAPTA